MKTKYKIAQKRKDVKCVETTKEDWRYGLIHLTVNRFREKKTYHKVEVNDVREGVKEVITSCT